MKLLANHHMHAGVDLGVVFGVPVGFATIIIISLITAAPKREIQELVEHVRYPNLGGSRG